MRVFLDTSAIYAIGSESDDFHEEAKKKLEELIDKDVEFVISNYVLLECISLLQIRQGIRIAKELIDRLRTGSNIIWVNEELHEQAWKYWKDKSKKNLSLVDSSSFIIMKRENIDSAFTFDRHFITDASLRIV